MDPSSFNLKMTSTGFLLMFFCVSLFGQQKEFEGIVYYKSAVKSNSELFSEKVIKSMFAIGNEMKVWIKKGNYKQSSGQADTYYLTKEQKIYIKFKNLDTLYVLNYSADSSTVKKISKQGDKRTIAGFECKPLKIELDNATNKYYYAPDLYMNPEYDKNNTIGRYDIFAKEASSLYLYSESETKTYTTSETCYKIQQTAISDSIFLLPDLPQKNFSIDELTIAPEFKKNGGWEKYILSSVNNEVALKYLKIPKGEGIASQTVIVKFLVNEFGRITYAEVENKKEVHAKLAEEALRIVNSSPLWKPPTIYGGEKSVFWLKIPITFQVANK